MNVTPSPAPPSSRQAAIPFREFFTFDLRSLAFFRIVLAIMIFLDWADRLPEARVLFSDEGILPRGIITGLHPFSLHMLSGSPGFQAALFILGMVVAVLMLVGWQTPLMCLLSFVLLVSTHARNPPALQGGDTLIKMLPFWGMFLPLGGCLSIDASRPGARPASLRVLSPATVAYLFQICMVYWFAAAWKWLGPWRDEGTAVYLTLQIDHFVTRLGMLLRQFPEPCRWLTHYTIWLESLGPALLLLPFNVGLQRLIAILLFVTFHAGLALCIELGHFPFVCMAAWMPFLPSEFWDKLLPRLGEPGMLPGWCRRWWSGLSKPIAESPAPLGSRRPAWQPPSGIFANLLVCFFFVYIAASNTLLFATYWMRMFTPETARRVLPLVPDQFLQLGTALGIDQGWGVFAPQPGRLVGWFLVAGYQKNGVEVDAFNGGPLSWQKPEYLTLTYQSGRWRRFRMNLGQIADYPYLVPGFAHFYYDEWNRTHTGDDRLRAVEVYWMREVTVLPGEVRPPPEKVLLGRYEPRPTPPLSSQSLMVVGTRADGQTVDVMRGGLPVDRKNLEERTDAPIVSAWYPLLVNLVPTDAAPHVLPGMARFLLDDWNQHHRPTEKLSSLEIVQKTAAAEGPPRVEVLARTAADGKQP
ncbi:MAG: HTTM domain-containing protein [Gemmataceae bacterium]